MLAGGLEDGRGACYVDGDGSVLISSLDGPTGYAAGVHDPIYVKCSAQIMNGLDIAHVVHDARKQSIICWDKVQPDDSLARGGEPPPQRRANEARCSSNEYRTGCHHAFPAARAKPAKSSIAFAGSVNDIAAVNYQ